MPSSLPAEHLTGWAEGMRQLQRLAGQLNALDEQKGKYLSVSELKTAVFAIMQSLNRAVPLEEQLRELTALPVGQPWSAARGSLAEPHLVTADRGVCPTEAKSAGLAARCAPRNR